jgi:hypothetical protein
VREGWGQRYLAIAVPIEISERVRRFIAQHVHSVAQLEVLLLLCAVPGREWSIDDVARARVSTPRLAEQLLEDLRERGLIARNTASGHFSYRPSAGLDAVLTDLAKLYERRRVAVVGLIFSKSSPL